MNPRNRSNTRERKIKFIKALQRGEPIEEVSKGMYYGVVIHLRSGGYILTNQITGETEYKKEEEFSEIQTPDTLGFVILEERDYVPEWTATHEWAWISSQPHFAVICGENLQ